MPRPEGGPFTFDGTRWRNGGGQFVPITAVLGPKQAPQAVSIDDAFELHHQGHVAGAAAPFWVRDMAEHGVRIVCDECGQTVALDAIELNSVHTRDWAKAV